MKRAEGYVVAPISSPHELLKDIETLRGQVSCSVGGAEEKAPSLVFGPSLMLEVYLTLMLYFIASLICYITSTNLVLDRFRTTAVVLTLF